MRTAKKAAKDFAIFKTTNSINVFHLFSIGGIYYTVDDLNESTVEAMHSCTAGV